MLISCKLSNEDPTKIGHFLSSESIFEKFNLVKIAQFLTVRHYFSLQDIKISFEDVDFYFLCNQGLENVIRDWKIKY